MEKLKLYFVKILKRLKLLSRFNFIISKKINDKRVKIPFNNGIGLTNLVIKEDWLNSLIKEFLYNTNKSFVDVGVNIGQTLIKVKTLYPKLTYLGFEPNSTCTSYSQLLVKSNHFQNCTIQNVALSSSIGILDLEKSYDVDSRASLISELRPNYFVEKEKILALDYSSFYQNEEIGFVKIDVEGAELEVLLGMKKALSIHKPIITCEVLDSHSESVLEFTQKRATKVNDLLKSIDYKVIRLYTNENKILRYEFVQEIKISQWSKESSYSNDYLFYPNEREEDVLNKINKMINI